jgi:subtilisin family serine protease
MMKKLVTALPLVVASFAAVACSDGSAPARLGAPSTAQRAASAASQPGALIPDQYIVVFRPDVADIDGTARQLAAANGASIQFVYRSALKGFAGQMSSMAADALARNPLVSYVEQDQVMTAIATTEIMDGSGDPWGLDRIDATSGLSGTYTYSRTGSGVVAYIIDTGIRTTHAEFGGRATGGYTAISDGNGTNDCNGHGTHVSGTVGGSTYGVAKEVSLVAVRVLDCGGSGSTAGVAAGIDWVTGHHSGPSVANMSLGGGASTTLDNAVRNSIASGVSYAIAAGNGNFLGIAQDACNYSPARVAEAMTIGATTKSDAKTSWSNYGSCVDWFAPGNGIKSAWATDDNATNTISGTSMATPHTTGVAALYLEANPSATPQQVRDALFAATTKGVVTSSSTANNHLLYTPPAGFGGSTTTNQPPTAAFTSSCTDLACSFTDASTDDGSVTGWSWTFGDGGTSSQQSPAHSYAAGGSYTVSLTVTDNAGATSTATTHQVTVTAPASSGATLSVTGGKIKGTWTATLTWSGFDAGVTSVDVYRNGVVIKAGQNNSGSTTDTGKGGGTFTYRVCAASSSTCTNDFTITM